MTWPHNCGLFQAMTIQAKHRGPCSDELQTHQEAVLCGQRLRRSEAVTWLTLLGSSKPGFRAWAGNRCLGRVSELASDSSSFNQPRICQVLTRFPGIELRLREFKLAGKAGVELASWGPVHKPVIS